MCRGPPGGIMQMFLDQETSGGSEEEEATVSSVEENKALVRRFLEAHQC
jgi:hypothetical protein